MKALVGAFNKEKALVGAFSVIVQPVVEPMDRFAALHRYALDPENYVLGAFFHYLDILQLFLAILMVICATNQCLK